MSHSVETARLPRDELADSVRQLVVIVEAALCAFERMHPDLDPEEHMNLFGPLLYMAAAERAGVLVQ